MTIMSTMSTMNTMSTMSTTNTAIILAGGRSLRMGFDKQLLKLNDQFLLEKNLSILLELFPQVIVVSNEPAELEAVPLIERTTIVSDRYRDAGPLAGIHAGLEASESAYALVLACDMPVIDPDYIRRMKAIMAQASGADGLINRNRVTGEPEPFCSFYGRHLLPELEQSIQSSRRSLRRFIDSHQFLDLEYASKPGEKDIFFNINDKRELRQYHEQSEPLALQLSQLSEAIAPPIQSVPIIRCKGSARAELEDEVITEAELTVSLNGEYLQTMYATPCCLEELITGNLYAQGLIQSASQIAQINIRRADDLGIHLQLEVQLRETAPRERANQPIITTSGTARPDLPFAGSLTRPDAELVLNLEHITRISAAFQDTSALFARTGGSHACALIQHDAMVAFQEDIGRHNALDKLIGQALREGRDLSSCLILLSGRMASEMTMKVLKTPVSALLSRAAPTDRSIRLAKEHNLTMMGFIRGDRLNVYHLNGGHRLESGSGTISPEIPSP